MSDNTAMAVYAQDSLVDVRIYRNFPLRDLVYETLALWSLYGTASTAREYLTARYPGEKLPALDRRGRVAWSEQRRMEQAQNLCDSQLILDLTNQAIYCGWNPLLREHLDCRREVSPRKLYHGSAWKALRGTYIDLRSVDPAAVRAVFRDWDGPETSIIRKICEKMEECA